MSIKQNKLHKNSLYLILILIMGFLLITIYIGYIGSENAEDASEAFANFYYDENKARIKREVKTRIGEIEIELENLTSDHLEIIEHEIKHLGYILEGLDISRINDPVERQKNAVDEFARMTIFDTEHSYFVIGTEGILLRSTVDESVVGTNLSETKDIEGNYYVKEMLKAKELRDGVYVTYLWPREKGGEELKKTSFCLYLEAYDIIIGTGVYHEDIEYALKETIFSNIQTYYDELEEYMFITGYDGISEVASSRDLVGRDLSAITDSDGGILQDKFMDVVRNEGRGFISYSYNEKNSNYISTKVSYVEDLPQWDAYMGFGFYTTDLKAVTEKYESDYRKRHYSEVTRIVLSLAIIAVLVLAFVKRGIKLLRRYMKDEECMFTQLIQMVNEGVIIVNDDNKVEYSNIKANTYFGNLMEPYFTGEQVDIINVQDDVLRINNDNSETYYVEAHKDVIIYNGESCIIHLIKNITSQYLKTNEFAQLSYIDDLTQLPNRRALVNDFNTLIQSSGDNSSHVIGMIDLDNFKIINDTYGHGFGDEILVLLSDEFRKRLRTTDKLYRYGGEEFVILINDIDINEAQKIVMDINVSYTELIKEKHNMDCTFSGGLVEIPTYGEVVMLKDIVSEADKKMYQAKTEGRNRIVI